jgi:hypothetical protein
MIIVAIENKIYLGTIIETITQETMFNERIVVSYLVNIGEKKVYVQPTQIYQIENIKYAGDLCK